MKKDHRSEKVLPILKGQISLIFFTDKIRRRPNAHRHTVWLNSCKQLSGVSLMNFINLQISLRRVSIGVERVESLLQFFRKSLYFKSGQSMLSHKIYLCSHLF